MTLTHVLDRYADLFEADLQRVYGVDLRDLWREGGLSIRRTIVLLRHLPADALTKSALWAETPDGADLPDAPFAQLWSTDQHLLAAVVDAVTSLRHTFIQANSKHKPPEWHPLPRPGERRPVHRRLSSRAIDRIRARNERGR